MRWAFSKWWVNRGIRAGRYLVIGGALVASGRQLGLVEYASDPGAKDMELLEAVVRSAGGQRVHVCGRTDPKPAAEVRQMERLVEPVVARCLCGARELVTSSLRSAAESPDKVSRMPGALAGAPEDQLKGALRRLGGAWRVVIVGTGDRPLVNAWVTALCPRTVFVTEALVQKLKPTPDELAMCLGHELSHLTLGHTEEKIWVSVNLALLQLVALAFVDPTGLFSFLGAEALRQWSTLYIASHSREAEEAADQLGLEIASAGCYDVRRGSNFMAKLADHSGHAPASWYSSHPATDDRLATVRGLAADLGAAQPYARQCAKVRARLESFGSGRREYAGLFGRR